MTITHYCSIALARTVCFVKYAGILVRGRAGGEDTFSRHGYRDWKHIDYALSKHECSAAHAIAMERNTNYRQCEKSDHGTILHQLLNPEGRQGEIIEKNREHVKFYRT